MNCLTWFTIFPVQKHGHIYSFGGVESSGLKRSCRSLEIFFGEQDVHVFCASYCTIVNGRNPSGDCIATDYGVRHAGIAQSFRCSVETFSYFVHRTKHPVKDIRSLLAN